MNETPETNAVVETPESGVDPFTALMHHARKLERERDMLAAPLTEAANELSVFGGFYGCIKLWRAQIKATAGKGEVKG